MKIKGILAAFAVLVIFITLQFLLPLVADRVTLTLLIFLVALGLMLAIFFVGGEFRWRLFLFTVFIATQTGELGVYFGGRLSTFHFEYLVMLAFIAWVLFDFSLNRPKTRMPWVVLFAFGLYGFTKILSLYYQMAIPWFNPFVEGGISDLNVIGRNVAVWLLTVAFVAAVHVYANSWKRVEAFVSLIILGAVLHSLLGVVEYLFPNQYYNLYIRLFPDRYEEVIRRGFYYKNIMGLFENGRGFATWLAFATPLVLYLCFYAKTNARRIGSAFLLLIILTAVFFTGSRAPSAIILISMYTFIIIGTKIKYSIPLTTALSAGLVFILLFGSQLAAVLPQNNLLDRWFNPTGGTFATLEPRKDIWRVAVDRWRENKLTGMGAGEFIQSQRKRFALGQELPAAHNAYIETLVDTGVIGALALAFLIGVTLRVGYVSWKKASRGKPRALATALGVAITSSYIAGFTEPAFIAHKHLFLYTLFLSFMIKIPQVTAESTVTVEESPPMAVPARRVTGKRPIGELPSPAE